MLEAATTAHGGEPSTDAPAWGSLAAAQKRDRVLDVAGELLAREGVDVPMPRLAEAVGVGVGSLYRQVGKKEDVVAALVVQRLTRIAARYEAAAEAPDRLVALREVVRDVIDECVNDHITRACWDYAVGRQDCDDARALARQQLIRMVDGAKEVGILREDASHNDFRALFRAAPSADLIDKGCGQRLGKLVLDGLIA